MQEEEKQKIAGKKKEKKVKISEEEYRTLKEKVSQAELLYDRFLRLQAEFENTRKRYLKEREEYIRFAHGAIAQEVLTVYDHFVIALSNIQASPEAEGNHNVILKGVQMIQSDLWELLTRNGVSKVETVGKPFNPEQHEAIATVEDDSYPEGTVIEEIRPGYLLYGKLLRPASVKIIKTQGEDQKPETSNQKPETADNRPEITDSQDLESDV